MFSRLSPTCHDVLDLEVPFSGRLVHPLTDDVNELSDPRCLCDDEKGKNFALGSDLLQNVRRSATL